MNDKDKDLIETAFNFSDGSDWNEIPALEKQAESEEAKYILHKRMVTLYRREEFFADQL